jgi:hypothetical protein
MQDHPSSSPSLKKRLENHSAAIVSRRQLRPQMVARRIRQILSHAYVMLAGHETGMTADVISWSQATSKLAVSAGERTKKVLLLPAACRRTRALVSKRSTICQEDDRHSRHSRGGLAISPLVIPPALISLRTKAKTSLNWSARTICARSKANCPSPGIDQENPPPTEPHRRAAYRHANSPATRVGRKHESRIIVRTACPADPVSGGPCCR